MSANSVFSVIVSCNYMIGVASVIKAIVLAVIKNATGGIVAAGLKTFGIVSTVHSILEFASFLETTNDCKELSIRGLKVALDNVPSATVDEVFKYGSQTFNVETTETGLLVASKVAPRIEIPKFHYEFGFQDSQSLICAKCDCELGGEPKKSTIARPLCVPCYEEENTPQDDPVAKALLPPHKNPRTPLQYAINSAHHKVACEYYKKEAKKRRRRLEKEHKEAMAEIRTSNDIFRMEALWYTSKYHKTKYAAMMKYLELNRKKKKSRLWLFD